MIVSNNIMKIPVNDLLDSLKIGYEEYRDCLEREHDAEDLSHVKGFCTTIEQILSSYGGITKSEILDIKKPLIGELSLRRKPPKVDYDVPTFIRKQQD